MMKIPVDLHIHTCLSPCAEADMTPSNIAAMAHLKGLAAISICDHNSCLNTLACIRAGERYDVIVVPGVEATTIEEVHALCYFPEYQLLDDFCTMLEKRRPITLNNPELFGCQTIMDENDNSTGEYPYWLGQAAELSIEELEQEVLSRGGVLVPSHINRQSQSLLANLGFIPPSLMARTMEVKGEYSLPPGYRPIRSSDAHSLGNILEDGYLLEVEDTSVNSIIKAMLA